MTRRKLRVLLDLSMTVHATSGIPQDARLLFKTLAMCPDIDLTGLVYSPHAFAPVHRFCRRGASRSDRLANQAAYLWMLAGGNPLWSQFRGVRIVKKLRHLAAMALVGRAATDPLDVEMFWQVIWRLLFSPTLSPDDMHLAREGRFLLSNICAGMIYARGMTYRRPIKLDTRGYDFLIVQGSRPFRVSRGTRKIVRYHDTIPVLQPDTRPSPMDIKWHHRSIKQSLEETHFVCNSEPTRDELTIVYPELRERSSTIPYMLSEMYRPESNVDMVRPIIDVRRSAATGAQPTRRLKDSPRYIMCVSTLEPRKNFVGLIQAFNALRLRPSVKKRVRDLKLLIVGSPGWQYEPTLAAMRELVARGELIHLERVPAEELRVLYAHAEAFVFPSHAEGFGFPPLEAMVCDTPVVASDVPAHRWVLGDAALYCNPYDSSSIAETIERLVASEESSALRAQLVARGRERVKRYAFETCASQWVELLHRLKEGPAAVEHQPFASSLASVMEQAA